MRERLQDCHIQEVGGLAAAHTPDIHVAVVSTAVGDDAIVEVHEPRVVRTASAGSRRPIMERMSVREIRCIDRWAGVRDRIVNNAYQFLFCRQPPV